jgi:hypothetical protein
MKTIGKLLLTLSAFALIACGGGEQKTLLKN